MIRLSMAHKWAMAVSSFKQSHEDGFALSNPGGDGLDVAADRLQPLRRFVALVTGDGRHARYSVRASAGVPSWSMHFGSCWRTQSP